MNSKLFAKSIPAAALLGMLMAGCDDGGYDGSPEMSEEELVKTYTSMQVETKQPMARGDQKSWPKPPAMMIDPRRDYSATIRTNMGDITLDLFEADAPKTVNNFVFLATEDFYDGVIFHRIIDNFMIQGGDPDGNGTGGPGYKFEDEVDANGQVHEPYTLSMANAGPNTNGSQFFITDTATPHLDGKHTVFGRVTEGRENVDAISAVPTGPRDRPVKDVVMKDVIIMVDGEAMNPPAEEKEAEGNAATTQPAE